MFKDMSKSTSCDFVVSEMVAEFTKLIQNEISGVFVHFITRVVDFLDIALGAGRAHDVRRINYPFVKPVKTFL